MDIIRFFSDIADVLKKPAGNTNAKQTPTPAVPVQDTDAEPKKEELRLTFKEAQQAGFQFCCGRRKAVIITSIHVKSDKIIIPAYIDGNPVTRIAGGCRFITERSVKNVTIVLPDTLTEIGENAFSKDLGCRNTRGVSVPWLCEVYFPEGRIMIGKKAFYNQRELKKLHFGADTIIREEAFKGCKELEKISLRTCAFSARSFIYCEKLSEVTWKNVTCYCDEVFGGTPFEKKNDLLIVGEVLQKCRTDKKQFTVPDGVRIIGKDAFKDNVSLEEVILPSSVIRIGTAAFANCRNLRNIDLSNVEAIDRDAFDNCISLDPKTKFKADVRFEGDPFRKTPLESKGITEDGIVINNTLLGGRPVFTGNVWQISENVRRISGDRRSFDFDPTWSSIPEMTVIFPAGVEHINGLNIFSFAKRLVFENPKTEITDSKGFPMDRLSRGNIILTFKTENGSSDIPFLFPKKIGDNPAYLNTVKLYNKVFDGEFDVKIYDDEILDTGMPMKMLIDIAYRRLKGGYKLPPENRTRYEEYLHLHISKAIKYAEMCGDKEMMQFFYGVDEM